jgi:hypothetical protein
MPILVVQRGHCHRKTGATGTTGEQAYATAVAKACQNLLHGRGGWQVQVILADEPLAAYQGDAFVAIHCDGSTSASARGASVGYRTPEGQRLAKAWKRAYAARGWSSGFRADNYTDPLAGYYGTRNAVAVGNRRAFIAECGFRTNAKDRAALDAPGGPSRVALAIGDALGIPHAEEGFLMTLNENQQESVLDGAHRVLGITRQRYWRQDGDRQVECGRNDPGAEPVTLPDRLDTAHLATRVGQLHQKVDALADAVAKLAAAVAPPGQNG